MDWLLLLLLLLGLAVQQKTSVYVTGLPDNTDVDEVAGVFSKCGIIKLDEQGQPKIKLYRWADRDKDSTACCQGVTLLLCCNGLWWFYAGGGAGGGADCLAAC